MIVIASCALIACSQAVLALKHFRLRALKTEMSLSRSGRILLLRMLLLLLLSEHETLSKFV
jgi:hypothetical protein